MMLHTCTGTRARHTSAGRLNMTLIDLVLAAFAAHSKPAITSFLPVKPKRCVIMGFTSIFPS